MSFFAEIDGFVAAHSGEGALAPFIAGLADAKGQLQEATLWLMQNGPANPDNAGAASKDYLELFGLTGLAWMWALMAKAALAKLAAGETDRFHADKLTVGRYFLARVLPDAWACLVKLKSGAAPVMALPSDAF